MYSIVCKFCYINIMVPKAPIICLIDGKLNKIKKRKEKTTKKGLKNKLKNKKKMYQKKNEWVKIL